MLKSNIVLLTFIIIGFAFEPGVVVSRFADKKPQQNHPPVVTIVSPANNANVSATGQIHYAIKISDKEDGDSKYDEINPKEVLFEVMNIADSGSLNSIENKADPAGLAILRSSNCFNCHNFDSKLIGPSFKDICQRYKPTDENIALLAKRIQEGSSGVWGNVTMPTHPEFTRKEVLNIVSWILANASNPSKEYYIGLEGVFHLPVTTKGEIFLLTASYLDNGVGADSTDRLKGEDHIVIRSE